MTYRVELYDDPVPSEMYGIHESCEEYDSVIEYTLVDGGFLLLAFEDGDEAIINMGKYANASIIKEPVTKEV